VFSLFVKISKIKAAIPAIGLTLKQLCAPFWSTRQFSVNTSLAFYNAVSGGGFYYGQAKARGFMSDFDGSIQLISLF
jgi:hypothetical protein